jgi:bifunctional DNA-binding transcriptional regulator/antitoxin component of YhaV-PrlF toxin-antitoxin module
MKVELDDVKCIKDTALTIIGSRRRLTVPSEIVETLELKNGDKLRWILFSNGNVQIRKVK